MVRAQHRRARGRHRLVFASADDGAHWVAVLDSTGRMADKRITRNVARFAACADGRWPADALILPADTPSIAAAAGADVLALRYGAPVYAEAAKKSRFGALRRAGVQRPIAPTACDTGNNVSCKTRRSACPSTRSAGP